MVFLERLSRYGPIAHFRVGRTHFYVLSDPELIRKVLVAEQHKFHKHPWLNLAKPMLGNGLLTSEGEFHRMQRRLAQPAFHPHRLPDYARTMVVTADGFQTRWSDGAVLDLSAEMMSLTLEVVAKTLLGASVANDIPVIANGLGIAAEQFRPGRLLFAPLLQRLPVPSTLRFRRAARALDSILYRVIQERRASSGEDHNLLSLLVSALDSEGDGRGLTDEQLRDQAMTIFLAGHETLANALAWTWLLLGQHPEAERSLHRELDSVVGDRSPSASDYERLSFTRAVLAESMRLYPPIWGMMRVALEDVELGGYPVPAGSSVVMSQWVIHRDATHFPQPERFRPERWLTTDRDALPRLAYFPFGAGSRICIGEGFAWMEGVLTIASVASRWRFELLPGQRITPKPRLTLRPSRNIQVRARRRAPFL